MTSRTCGSLWSCLLYTSRASGEDYIHHPLGVAIICAQLRLDLSLIHICYGLSAGAVHQLAAGGPGLLITVDCGVNYPEEVALAQSLGMEVVVTDHHTLGETMPRAVVVLSLIHICSELIDQLNGVHQKAASRPLGQHAGQLVKEIDIALDLLSYSGALHLHGNDISPGQPRSCLLYTSRCV